MLKTIYTIGYQGITLDRLVEIMDAERIDKLLDVRSVPFSRWRVEFNPNAMAMRLSRRYCWKGKLLGGKFGPATEEGIQYLLGLPDDRRFLLMCMERDPLKCHRHYDIGARLTAAGVEVLHFIDQGGPHATAVRDSDL